MEFQLKSGATLVVTDSSYDDADALVTALLNSAKGMELKEDFMNMDLSEFIQPILSAATSREVKVALFKCFERVTYNGHRMSKALLDDPEIGITVREDFYEIAIKVIEVNCKPFFKRTFSLFSGLRAKSPASPEQK